MVSIPLPTLVRVVSVPVRRIMEVSKAPLIVRPKPMPLTTTKANGPLLAPKVCDAESLTGHVMDWRLLSLLRTPFDTESVAWRRSSLVITKLPAGLPEAMDRTLTGAFTTGPSRRVPRKMMAAVPSFSGTVLGFQLFAVVQASLAPPPSEVWAWAAVLHPTAAARSRRADRCAGVMAYFPFPGAGGPGSQRGPAAIKMTVRLTKLPLLRSQDCSWTPLALAF